MLLETGRTIDDVDALQKVRFRNEKGLSFIHSFFMSSFVHYRSYRIYSTIRVCTENKTEHGLTEKKG